MSVLNRAASAIAQRGRHSTLDTSLIRRWSGKLCTQVLANRVQIEELELSVANLMEQNDPRHNSGMDRRHFLY